VSLSRLNQNVIAEIAKAVRRDRYLSHQVSDEQLVERIVTDYLDATRRRRPPRPVTRSHGGWQKPTAPPSPAARRRGMPPKEAA
jgi:hypothetical protein